MLNWTDNAKARCNLYNLSSQKNDCQEDYRVVINKDTKHPAKMEATTQQLLTTTDSSHYMQPPEGPPLRNFVLQIGGVLELF